MRPLARLAEQMAGAAGDDLLAERDKGGDHVAQGHQLGPAAVQRQHVDAKARLQRGVAVELVQHDVGHGIALQLDDDPHAVAVALVAQLGDAFDELVAHAFGDALDQLRLVDLIGDLGEDDRLAVLADLLDMRFCPQDHRAAAGLVGGVAAGPADDDPAGRKIRRRHVFHQFFDGDGTIVEIGAAGVDDLAEIVRRDVGRHADRDALGAVDQEVREAGRQYLGLVLGLVVIGLEIDGVVVEVVEQRIGDAREPRLGVAIGRRRIAVHRAEIALAVDQRQAHRKILRHPHHRVVDRQLAMRVVLADHVADDARRFAIAAVPLVAVDLHRIKDAAVHRL